MAEPDIVPPLIVTIDGPAGVGKSTLAKRLAKALGIPFLDTGAMYRTVGLHLAGMLQNIDGLDPKKLPEKLPDTLPDELNENLRHCIFTLEKTPEGEHLLFCNGTPLGPEIRTEAAGHYASIVGQIPLVREKLQENQREIGAKSSLVAEGRDMGTRVFPKATVKIFLDARLEVRAARRLKELQEKEPGFEKSLEEIIESVSLRDAQDKSRALDPLVPAPDAHIIDTSDLTREQVDTLILRLVHEAAQRKPKTGPSFSHITDNGGITMVDTQDKKPTLRTATATAVLEMANSTMQLLKDKALPKGDALTTAKVAGILAAKHCAELIPLCHPLPLSFIDVRFRFLENSLLVETETRAHWNTGVEMEALVAAQIAAATIYDMVKAVEPGMAIRETRVTGKTGGTRSKGEKNRMD